MRHSCHRLQQGAVSEVIDDGVSGFLVSDIAEAVAALKVIEEFDRTQARLRFEQRFTIERVARDYLNIYRRLPESGALGMIGRPGLDKGTRFTLAEPLYRSFMAEKPSKDISNSEIDVGSPRSGLSGLPALGQPGRSRRARESRRTLSGRDSSGS